MLIIALVLAVVGLAALVFAVVTSNEFIAYVCIAASVLGVVLLIVDALRERQRRGADGVKPSSPAGTGAELEGGTETADPGQDGGGDQDSVEDYPEQAASEDAEKASSPRTEPGAGASAEPGGSDEYDHGTAGQTAAGKDNTDNTS